MPHEDLSRFADNVSQLMPDILREFLRRQTKEIAQGNISLPQILILDVLKDKASMRMGELAKYLSVTMAATTGIVDKMVKNSFVIRAGSPHDRRVVNISITPNGKRIVEKYNQARQKTIIEMFGSLTASDRSTYLEILSKIHKYLQGRSND